MWFNQSQDEEIGDGTTSIVILASALLQQAKKLLENGVHPIRISEGLSLALNTAVEHLESISESISDMKSTMLKAAKTSLNSKIVSINHLSELCVEAILSVADIERNDVDLDLINIQTKIGKI